jgi:hypothetical protein
MFFVSFIVFFYLCNSLKGRMSSSSCSKPSTIYSDFNYETLREQNLQKVQDYYNQVLSTYTTQYNDYLSKSTSSDQADKDKAKYMISEGNLPKMNLHLIDIINEMNNTIEQDVTNLKNQQEKVKKDNSLILANRQLIDDLNRVLKQKSNDNSKNISSYTETNNDNINNWYWEIGFIIVNVILFIIVCWCIYKYLFTNNSKNI